jgi:hypothetical protein
LNRGIINENDIRGDGPRLHLYHRHGDRDGHSANPRLRRMRLSPLISRRMTQTRFPMRVCCLASPAKRLTNRTNGKSKARCRGKTGSFWLRSVRNIERKIESAMPRQNRELLAEVGQEYRANALELMTANVKANLEYANKLRKLTTPFEFIELLTAHARKQFELIMSQALHLSRRVHLLIR